MNKGWLAIFIILGVICILLLVPLILQYYGVFRYCYLGVNKTEKFIERYEKIPKSSERVVISFTSIPKRIGKTNTTIKSLLDQTIRVDEIALNIPKKYRRFDETIEIPTFIKNNPYVKIYVTDEDYGPGTKLVPTLKREQPDTKIIIIDDDMIFGRDFVKTMIEWSNGFPNQVITNKGWNARKFSETGKYKDGDSDIFAGYAGVLLKPKFFDSAAVDTKSWIPSAFFSDDSWMSGHLARKGVPIKTIGYKGYYNTPSIFVQGLSWSGNKKNDKKNVNHFKDYWPSFKE